MTRLTDGEPVCQRITKGGGLLVARSPDAEGRGYRLTLPPLAVTVGQVIRVLDRPVGRSRS